MRRAGGMIMSLKRKAGFSLVEVSLALLVATMGVLAVYSLFPEGLGAVRRAVDASESSAFAGFVFDTLQAVAYRDWNLLGQANFPNASNWPWVLGSRTMIRDSAGSNDSLPEYYVRAGGPHYYPWQPHLLGKSASEHPTYTGFTYKLDIDSVTDNLKWARLQVWVGPDLSKSSKLDKMPSTVFYREFYHY